MKKRVLSVVLVISMFLMLTVDGFASGGDQNSVSDPSGIVSETIVDQTDYSMENIIQVNELADTQRDLLTYDDNVEIADSESDYPIVDERVNDYLFAENAASGKSWETAAVIDAGVTYTDRLAEYSDKNYYLLKAGKPGELSITFDHDYVDSSSGYWDVNIYKSDDHNESLVKWTFIGNETVAVKTGNSLGVDAGNYYIVVDRSSYYSDEEYRIKVNYTESDYWEKEPNDNAMKATQIPVNTEINGSLQEYSDYDYYSFELSKPGSFQISFNHDLVDSSNTYWNMKLYDYTDLNNSFVDWDFIGNATVTEYSPYFGLPAGTFILVISRDNYYSSNNYRFKVEYSESEFWEREYNNSVTYATKMTLNETYYGGLQDYSDEDYYSVVIPKEDNISFSFSHGMLDSSSQYWKLTVYDYSDVNTRLLEESFIGNMTEAKTKSLHVQPGTYIIRIARSSYYSCYKYGFCINSSGNTVKVTSVKLEKSSEEVNVGAYGQIKAIVLPENAANKTVTWKSSNTKVLTIDSDGKYYGVKDGVANITVTTNDGNYTATATITVGTGVAGDPAEPGPEPGPETEYDTSDPDIELELADDGNYHYTLLLGEKYSINIEGLDKASVKPGDESIVKLADKKKGIVQAKKIGSTYAVCTVYGEVKIVQFKVVFPVICAEDGYMLVGESMPLSIKGTAIENVKWSVNGTNADISDDGILTANKPGTVQVTATIHKLNYKTKIIIESPKFAKSSYTVKAGAMAKIVLSGTKQGMRVKYTVEDENKAAILPDGRIAGLTPGITTLYATLGDKTFSTMIEVK